MIDEDENKILAYLSLCSDSLQLDLEEKKELGFPYLSIPALKIARLAVSIEHRNRGIGKLMINYVAHTGENINKHCGIAFMTLDCYEHRISFYEHNGFEKNKIQEVTLPFDTPISMRISLNKYLETIEDNKSLH